MPLYLKAGTSSLLRVGTSLASNSACCCATLNCTCSTCSPAQPSAISASFPKLYWLDAGSGACLDSGSTFSVTLNKCSCVDTTFDNSNQCIDYTPGSAYPSSAYRGYAGFAQIATRSVVSTGCCIDGSSCTFNYRYYLAVRADWYCCRCDGRGGGVTGARGFWLLSGALLSAYSVSYPPGCGTSTCSSTDFNAIEAAIASGFGCGTNRFAWPAGTSCVETLTNRIRVSGCTGFAVPLDWSLCSSSVCSPTGTFTHDVGTLGNVSVS